MNVRVDLKSASHARSLSYQRASGVHVVSIVVGVRAEIEDAGHARERPLEVRPLSDSAKLC